MTKESLVEIVEGKDSNPMFLLTAGGTEILDHDGTLLRREIAETPYDALARGGDPGAKKHEWCPEMNSWRFHQGTVYEIMINNTNYTADPSVKFLDFLVSKKAMTSLTVSALLRELSSLSHLYDQSMLKISSESEGDIEHVQRHAVPDRDGGYYHPSTYGSWKEKTTAIDSRAICILVWAFPRSLI